MLWSNKERDGRCMNEEELKVYMDSSEGSTEGGEWGRDERRHEIKTRENRGGGGR